MRDNCVDNFFYPRPYKCGVLPHLAQAKFCDPPFMSAAIEASSLQLTKMTMGYY